MTALTEGRGSSGAPAEGAPGEAEQGAAAQGAVSTAPLRVLLREDLRTHGRLSHPGLHVLAVYRVGHWRRSQPALVRKPVSALYKLVDRWVVRTLYGTEISDRARIGRQVKIGHHQALMVPAGSEIGDGCLLRQGVSIGYARDGAPAGAVPRLGRRVEVGPHSVIIGPITIGDDVKIGPLSLVSRSVPAGATVFSAPARVMPAPPRG
ncbi:serine O-acetyltransferase [Vallicoccus soli]|uniref:Serine acetyltransferase n=1 Tax=Vallicoccus soli TaxID=2339232 RepID=A0A3A3Z9V0_9ACTN|nr:serine acetyltransferase [Vallicoccus soli]RJK97866.1 serine acetyltransferase [Vallicoccus soli]